MSKEKTKGIKKKSPVQRVSKGRSERFEFGKKTAMFVIVAAVFIVFVNSVGNQFVFDDSQIIVGNQAITSLKNIPDILGLGGKLFVYRPVRTLSYTIDYFFSGLNPAGFHFFNILYHAVSSVLVYLIILQLAGSSGVAFFAAILFAVHPVQTDSVTYLSGRRDVLCGLFYFLGFYFFLKYRQRQTAKYMAAAFIAYGLGMLSKEMAVTLPVVFLAYDFISNLDEGPFFTRVGNSVKAIFYKYKFFYSFIFLCAGGFIYYKLFIMNPSQAPGYYGGSALSNFLTVARVIVHYIQLLFFPIHLNADYSFNAFPVSKSLFEWPVLASIAFLAVVFWLILRSLNVRDKYLAFGGMWFFITLLPVMQIFPHHELLAEHYLYQPMFGFALVLALLLERAIQHAPSPKPVYAAFVVIALLLSCRTIVRNRDWKDDLTLWTKTVATSPDCARARNNLGRALNNAGEPSAAINEFKEAIRIRPDFAEAYCNLGTSYVLLGLRDQAGAQFDKAIKLNPGFAEAYYNRGLTLAEDGKIEQSIKLFQRAVRLNPSFTAAHFNLGYAYSMLHDNQKALIHLRRVLELSPGTPVAEKSQLLISKLDVQ